MKKCLLLVLFGLMTIGVQAQRVTDKLDRGLVAMKVNGGVYLSWRIFGEEYYDVTYNVYRDGVKVNDAPLSVSNYTDKGATTASTYAVAAVVNGKEQEKCKEVTPWGTSYKEIKLKHEGIQSTLIPNDASCADVDGDGELEILMKFDNLSEMNASYPKGGYKGEYSIFECLKMDGTRLWWVNCGPNMGDFQNNEQNIVGYDWDGDGCAEVVMRACDGTVIHMADGTTYTVGNASTNVRAATGGGTNWFVITTGEYLVYMDGKTGKPYECLPYPLKLLESGETDVNKAWGDGYGHRASKHFFGAPYFDGRKPSIFLARGIYTRHKMIAYDVDPQTHKLKERWRWFNNTNGPWKGQGYHNYCVADVDLDGRDEIVFGSMVIDDNGKGLSTTGFGHGDAEHVGDLNPYAPGLEIYACMEDHAGNNYRDATTSKVYHRYVADRDDGRAMAGNFTNSFPGGLGCSSREGAISTVTGEAVSGLEATGVNTNFRIYWDGDLCEETFNYLNGKNTEGCVAKYGSWTPIYTCAGSMTNNDTKGTPCYQGDILGDWREEIIMRTGNNNIRIYSTPTETKWRNYTLWHDHQYRNAMVWQMCGYNQPPHTSYFLGELEGITIAPPPLTMTGRTEVANGGTVGKSLDGQNVIICETGNTTVSIEGGAQPAVLTFNVPTWVQGTAPSESTNQNTKINYTTYNCVADGGGIGGAARLVKQGDGVLTLPKADFTHTGNTDIWGGTLNFDGTMKQSPLWLNRFARLNSNGGEFLSIKADYGSAVCPGGEDAKGTITADEMSLGFGSRVVLDLFGSDLSSDYLKVKTLKIERKTGAAWTKGGPEYLMPVIEVVGHLANGASAMAPGKYVIGEVENVEGKLDDLILEGMSTIKKKLYMEDGKLIVEVIGLRDAGQVKWSGSEGNKWDYAETQNFMIGSEQTVFVSGDDVTFNNEAGQKSISLNGDLYPGVITIEGTNSFSFTGNGSWGGDASFVHQGTGTVSISNKNSYTGGNHLKGGTTKVSLLSNQYSAVGNLGGLTTKASLFTMENGAILQTTAAVENGSPMQMIGDEGGVINNAADFIMAQAVSGTVLTKKGNGTLKLNAANSLTRLVIAGGLVTGSSTPAKTVEFQGGTLNESTGTSYTIYVPEGKTGTWNMANRSTYKNKVTGKGTLNANCVTEKGTNYYATRTPIECDFSQFEGTLKPSSNLDDPAVLRFTLNTGGGMPKGTMNIAATVEVQNSGKTFTIGKVMGSGKLGGSCTFSNGASVGANTWQVGNDDDWATTVKVTSNANFVKLGAGRINWNGANSNTGATTIKAGELCLGTSANLGTGRLSVEAGATLSGNNTAKAALANSSVNISGTLQPGNSAAAATGSLYFDNKNVTIGSGGKLVIRAARNGGSTTLEGINTLTINGTICVQAIEGHTLKVGDEIRLWSETTKLSGTPTFDMQGGVTWDTSRISEGVLVVKDVVTGISGALADSDPLNVYDLQGRLVSRQATATSTEGLPKGIYIRGGRKVIVK